MIIIYDKPGQLCNQLWAYSNLIAMAKEGNSSVLILFKKSYIECFDRKVFKTAKAHKVFIYSESSLFGKCIRRISNFFVYSSSNTKAFKDTLMNLLSVKVLKQFVQESEFRFINSNCWLVFINSWEQRENKTSFFSQSDFIRSLFIPKIEFIKEANYRIKSLRKRNSIIIGVHIRRGDYRTFLGGKYFYNDDVYCTNMKRIKDIIGNDDLIFYIFSDENISLHNFSSFKFVFFEESSSVGDLWAMSNCDFIIGPVSTFSMWASFWKRKPLYFIDKDRTIESMNEFKPIIAQDVFFENDKIK